MSLSAPCSRLLEVCSILCAHIVSTCVGLFLSPEAGGDIFLLFSTLLYENFNKCSNHDLVWLIVMTINTVLLHNPHTRQTLIIHTGRLWLLAASPQFASVTSSLISILVEMEEKSVLCFSQLPSVRSLFTDCADKQGFCADLAAILQ